MAVIILAFFMGAKVQVGWTLVFLIVRIFPMLRHCGFLPPEVHFG